MKLDRIDWKICAIKVGETNFLEHRPPISNDFDHHLWRTSTPWTLN